MFGERKPYQGFNFLGRLKALGVHLVFSIIIFLIFLWVFLTYWYPAPHFQINGGWQGIRIMVLVDLVIGPLLTFLLFNNRKSKKELKFDLAIIITFQIGLLVYGLQTIYSQRPVVQVLSFRGKIYSPRYEDLVFQPSQNPIKVINNLNVFNTVPPTVYGDYLNRKRKDQSPYINLTDTEVDESMSSFTPYNVISTYLPMNSVNFQNDLPSIAERAMDILTQDEKKKKVIEEYKRENTENFYFFNFIGEFGEAIAVLDKTGKPIDFIGIDTYSYDE